MSRIQPAAPIILKTFFFACFLLIRGIPDKSFKTTTSSAEDHNESSQISEPGEIFTRYGARVKLLEPATLICKMKGDSLSNFKWVKIVYRSNYTDEMQILTNTSSINANSTRVTMSLNFGNVERKDNGTYRCSANDLDSTFSSECDLIVIEAPEVQIEFGKAVGSDRVYLNWTVNDWNDAVEKYIVEYMKKSDEKWIKYVEEIGGRNHSYVLEGLEKDTEYQFRIMAYNSVDESNISTYPKWIKTFEEDLVFVPEVSIVEKIDNDSITIVWEAPPKEMQDLVHYYEIMAIFENKTEKYKCPAEPTNIYKFLNLETDVNSYQFNVLACNNYTKQCYVS